MAVKAAWILYSFRLSFADLLQTGDHDVSKQIINYLSQNDHFQKSPCTGDQLVNVVFRVVRALYSRQDFDCHLPGLEDHFPVTQK